MILDVLGMPLTLQTTPINPSVKFYFVLKLDYFGVIHHFGPISNHLMPILWHLRPTTHIYYWSGRQKLFIDLLHDMLNAMQKYQPESIPCLKSNSTWSPSSRHLRHQCDILHQKVATFLAGSLESQLGIEIQSLENTEHCQVGQMSVGSTLYGTFLPKSKSKSVSHFSRRVARSTVLGSRSNDCPNYSIWPTWYWSCEVGHTSVRSKTCGTSS